MSKRLYYFYICDDCQEMIPQRLDTIKNFKNPVCRTCYNRRKGRENRDKISKTITAQWMAIPKEKRIEMTECMRTDSVNKERCKKLKKRYENGELHAWNEGNHTCLNTGKTHFKKGIHYNPDSEFKPLDKHIYWKGGISFVRGQYWMNIRNKIVNRDKICQKCGNIGALEVHHIIPYRINEDNSKRNLISLCDSCHHTLEWMYEKEETRPMYFQFINGWRNKTDVW